MKTGTVDFLLYSIATAGLAFLIWAALYLGWNELVGNAAAPYLATAVLLLIATGGFGQWRR